MPAAMRAARRWRTDPIETVISPDVRASAMPEPRASSRVRAWWWIAAAFLGVQICIACVAANGPFVDEGLYTVAGMRVLEGKGLSDGYITWFNGSPFVWPVMAAVGHHLGGLTGARLMAVIISMVTLVGFAKTAEALFGESAAAWGTRGAEPQRALHRPRALCRLRCPRARRRSPWRCGARRDSRTSREVRWLIVRGGRVRARRHLQVRVSVDGRSPSSASSCPRVIFGISAERSRSFASWRARS